jgi:predicted transposase YbfD/YdcC
MQSLLSIFREVRDPRDFNAWHDLPAMLFSALAATLCGAKSCVDIADFVAANVELLGEIVDLPHGAPSHDCFSRVFRLLDPEEMAQVFGRFVAALREGLGLRPANGVVAVDGKRLRRGYERGRACMPPLMVSVWDAETRLTLATRHAPGGNEVAATLAALKGLVLKGCTVTADALHCHPAMATEIRKTGAHYALKLKANNGPLFKCVEDAFAAADKRGKLDFHEESEFAHDRHERRRASVIKRPRNAPDFPDLAAIGRIEAERQVGNGKLVKSVHYVVLSKRLTPLRMLDINRTHWCIENQLHWPLDVTFREDDARTRKDYGPQNLAVIRKIAIDILRAHPDKRSVGRKMHLAAWKQEFFFDLFTHLR